MIKSYLTLLVSLVVFQLQAQYVSGVTVPDSTKALITDESAPRVKYANTITAEDMERHLTVLASDGYEGRETGTPGNLRAAGYISNFFKTMEMTAPGLENSYYQPIALTYSKWDDIDIFVGENNYRHLRDFIAFPHKNTSEIAINAEEVIYLGYGIDDPKYSD